MKQCRILSTFACGVIVLLVRLSASQARRNVPDIRQFLSVDQPICLRSTTAGRGPDCKVDVIDKVNGTYVLLRRFIGYTKLIISDFQQFFEGLLGSSIRRHRGKAFDVMNVGHRAGADCTYELRSKNPLDREASAAECLKVYNKATKGKGRRISDDVACEDILKGRDNLIYSINTLGRSLGVCGIMGGGYPVSPATAFLQYFATIPILRPTWEA